MTFIDIALVVIVGFFLLLGLRRGTVNELLRIIGILIALFASFQYYHQVAAIIENYTTILFPTSEALAFAFILVSIVVAYYFLLRMVTTVIQIKLIPPIDKMGGVIIGFVKGVIIASLALIMLLISPLRDNIREVNARSHLAPYLVKASPKIYDVMMAVYPDGKNFISRDFFEEVAANNLPRSGEDVPEDLEGEVPIIEDVSPEEIPSGSGEAEGAQQWE